MKKETLVNRVLNKKGNVLPPVTVVGHSDEPTAKFYRALQESDPYSYSALMDMGKKYGFAKVRLDGKSDDVYGTFDLLSNTIHIHPSEDRTDVHTYLNELAHKIQRDRGLGSFLLQRALNDIPAQVTGKDVNLTKGTTEYEAHRQIAPELLKEFDTRVNTSPEYIPMRADEPPLLNKMRNLKKGQ